MSRLSPLEVAFPPSEVRLSPVEVELSPLEVRLSPLEVEFSPPEARLSPPGMAFPPVALGPPFVEMAFPLVAVRLSPAEMALPGMETRFPSAVAGFPRAPTLAEAKVERAGNRGFTDGIRAGTARKRQTTLPLHFCYKPRHRTRTCERLRSWELCPHGRKRASNSGVTF